MIYCFAKELEWDYSKREMAISKINGNGILYDTIEKVFLDFDYNKVDITGQTIFPRTGVTQIYDMIDSIEKYGGTSIISKEDVDKVEEWPKYYTANRKIQILKGKDLINPEIVNMIENTYGQEFFLKTMRKNFNGVLPIELLKDKDCAFYKTLMHHLEEDFFVSEKVNIVEDECGKKEYRCFIVNGEIYNISRMTTEVFHQVDEAILKKLKNVVETVKNKLPDCYVVDLFEYELNGERFIDVVEFNSIHSSGLYLYNSCIEKSDDLLHENIKAVANEFIDTMDECMMEGSVVNERDNLYDIPGSFSNNLRAICAFGEPGGWIHGIKLSVESFKRHDPMISLETAKPITDDDFHRSDKEILDELLQEGLSEEVAKQYVKDMRNLMALPDDYGDD